MSSIGVVVDCSFVCTVVVVLVVLVDDRCSLVMGLC